MSLEFQLYQMKLLISLYSLFLKSIHSPKNSLTKSLRLSLTYFYRRGEGINRKEIHSNIMIEFFTKKTLRWNLNTEKVCGTVSNNFVEQDSGTHLSPSFMGRI